MDLVFTAKITTDLDNRIERAYLDACRPAAMVEKGLVVVTGAEGFLASWLVKCLLERGYRVWETVRDPDNEKKTAHLWGLPGVKERLELVQADLLTEGSFDAAVDRAEGIFHTASPVAYNPVDPEKEMVEPSIEGALNLLRSVIQAKSVKKVVLTSSSSLLRFRPGYSSDVPLDESSWSSVPFCKQLKLWYALAKTSTEEAAWDLAKKNGINLVTVCPTFIVGYALPPNLFSTAADILGILNGVKDKFFFLGWGYVHILDDDVTAHNVILAYEKPEAEGRYIVDFGVLDTKEMTTVIAKCYPHLDIPTEFEGQKGMPYYTFDASKLKKLGFENYKSLGEMFDDAMQSFKDKGLL